MERFPAEILSQIICALSEEGDLQLAPYATISHRFRAAVEQQTFAYLILNTHDLPQLREAFKDSNAYRRGFLSSILFRFVLPDEGPDPCCEAGRMIDREADSSSFTESVKTLFDIVQDASKSCLTAPPPLYLRFVDATRNTDPPYRNYGRCSRRREKHDEDDKVFSKAQRGFYDFAPLAAGKLPILDDVTEFDFGGGYDLEDAGRRWMGHVLGQLPALERLSIDVTDVIELGLGIRNSLGEDLSSSLARLPFAHLKQLTLSVRSTRLTDEALTPPNPIHNSISLTPLATIAYLTKLHLNGPYIITPDFFDSLPPTAFPALKHFHLDFAPESADGQWFFERDEQWIAQLRKEDEDSESESPSSGSEDDEEDYDSLSDTEELPVIGKNPSYEGPVSWSRARLNRFRTLPSSTTMTPLLLGAAKIAKTAPCLRQFVMQVRNGLNPETEQHARYIHPQLKRVFLLVLLRPGERCTSLDLELAFDEERYNDQHRMWWRVGDRWRPEKKILTAWKESIGDMGTVGFLAEGSFEKDAMPGCFREFFRGEPDIA